MYIRQYIKIHMGQDVDPMLPALKPILGCPPVPLGRGLLPALRPKGMLTPLAACSGAASRSLRTAASAPVPPSCTSRTSIAVVAAAAGPAMEVWSMEVWARSRSRRLEGRQGEQPVAASG